MKREHWSNGKTNDQPASWYLDYEVTTTDQDGALECTQQSLEKLTVFVGAILDELPDDAQNRVLKNAFYWREPCK